jgi:protein YIPF6
VGVCVSVCERLFRGGGCLLALSSHCALTMAGLSGAMDSGTTGRGSSLGGSVGSLDEPVSETILRDWNKIYVKLRVVLRPQSNQEETLRELRQWDLWGPLLLCLLLSVMLSIGAPVGQEMLLFSSVFFIYWVGSAVVTLNAQLLGGKISFFQSVCVLGYCMFPLNIGSVLCYLWTNWLWRVVVTSVCMYWSCRASVVFISQMIDPKKKILAVYPVILFYLVISWMILISG